MLIDLLSPEFLGSSVLALGSAAVWLRRQRVGLSKDNADVAVQESNAAAATAVSDVINLMRGEVQRLNEVNSSLGKQLVQTQASNIAMQAELVQLKEQNSILHQEIVELKTQLAKLSKVMEGLSDCSTCDKKVIG